MLKLTEQLARWKDENVRLAEIKKFVALLIDTFADACAERGTTSVRLGRKAVV